MSLVSVYEVVHTAAYVFCSLLAKRVCQRGFSVVVVFALYGFAFDVPCHGHVCCVVLENTVQRNHIEQFCICVSSIALQVNASVKTFGGLARCDERLNGSISFLNPVVSFRQVVQVGFV